jgi:hypothetical protein
VEHPAEVEAQGRAQGAAQGATHHAAEEGVMAKAKTKPRRAAKPVMTKMKPKTLSESDMEAVVEIAMDEIDEHCAPARMNKHQAKDYYERLIDRCQTAVEALEQEIENAE